MRMTNIEFIFDIGEDFMEHIKQMKNMGYEARTITRFRNHIKVDYEHIDNVNYQWFKYRSAFYEKIDLIRGDL